jgi:hypothetical protein
MPSEAPDGMDSGSMGGSMGGFRMLTGGSEVAEGLATAGPGGVDGQDPAAAQRACRGRAALSRPALAPVLVGALAQQQRRQGQGQHALPPRPPPQPGQSPSPGAPCSPRARQARPGSGPPATQERPGDCSSQQGGRGGEDQRCLTTAAIPWIMVGG